MSTPSIRVGQSLGHYRILEKIGGGGQGEVFRAHDESFDRIVALKILPLKALADDDARKQFRQEALAVGRLNHPNIATAFYFGEENGVDFLVTEYISGTGLDDQISRGPLPEATVLALGVQFASGLEAAHHEGIIHRDLKPGNLRITDTGQVKILDFGLAELIDPAIDIASAETVTLTMTLTGTLPYMAPEQFEGMSDQRSDLWAAGVVLYEMATGQRPFAETLLARLKDAILHKDPARPTALNPSLSQGLERVILRALEKDPKRRYQTAAELREDLSRLAEGKKVKQIGWLQEKVLPLAVVAVLLAATALVCYHFWPQIAERIGRQSTEIPAQFRLLAVLPVDTPGPDTGENALVRGMAETVSARIAQETNGQKLQLIPPSELISRGAKTTDAAQREFGVERVLEVSVQRSGDQVRVTCSLIDSRTHQLVRACTVTGDGSELFALQDKLVGEVIAMLPKDTRIEREAPTEVLAAAPASYEAYLKGRGFLLEYQKPENIDAAVKQFEQALKPNPNYAPALAGLGQAYWLRYKSDKNKEWLDKAMTACNAAVETNPKLAEGRVCLSNVYRSHGQYDRALQEINQAIAIDNNDVQAVLALGDTLDKLDRYPEAVAAFQKAAALNPNYWAVYNWAGFFYYGRANYAEAEKMFRRAASLAPGNNLVLENLGGMYLLEGRYQDAIDVLNHSIQLRPTLTAYSNLGAAFFYLHKFPESVSALRKASELDGRNYIAWGDLADALYWTPDQRSQSPAIYRKAIDLARGSVKVNPKDSGALSCLASYTAMLGDRDAALGALREALAVSPNDPDVMFRAAVIYNHFGEREQTMDWLRKATQAGFSKSTVRDTPDFAQLQQDSAFRSIAAP
jgi:tetratricopeptide (TPR) repeat protein